MRTSSSEGAPGRQNQRFSLAKRAGDFVQTDDIWFRPIFAFFIVNVATREVVRVSATRARIQQWMAQRLRNATPLGEGPRFIIRKFGTEFCDATDGAEKR